MTGSVSGYGGGHRCERHLPSRAGPAVFQHETIMVSPTADDVRRSRRRRITLSQLAAQLDVSTATVSLALRDNPAVSAKTRERVQALAREMGYIYNRQAASLRTACTNIIGVVVHDVLNPYFAEVFRAVEAELEPHGITILICNHRDDLHRQKTFVDVLQQQNADGLVICPSEGTSREDIEAIVRSGTPVTIICRDVVCRRSPGSWLGKGTASWRLSAAGDIRPPAATATAVSKPR
jgi:hypothetical protein